MLTEYLTCITHSFIGVFNDTPDNGLNNWTQGQSEQGFSWRPGSVSFGTIDGIVALVGVEIITETELEIREHAMRVIRVPFEVGDTPVVIADVITFHEVTIPIGEYALIFQHWWIDETEVENEGEPDMWCLFSFVPAENAQPFILRADAQLAIPDSYIMEATQAY